MENDFLTEGELDELSEILEDESAVGGLMYGVSIDLIDESNPDSNQTIDMEPFATLEEAAEYFKGVTADEMCRGYPTVIATLEELELDADNSVQNIITIDRRQLR